jgi:anti-sigma-K factor RskA
MDHSRITEQLEAYLLGALAADERHAVERHLAGCAECRRLVNDLGATVDLLPLALAAASPLRPPADLKDRVLQAARAPSLAAPPKLVSAPANLETSEPSRLSLGDGGMTRRGRGRVGRWSMVTAAVAIVVVALSLAWGVRLSEALDQERALRQRVAAHFSQQQEIVLEVVDAEKGTRIILRAPEPDSPAYGKLFTRPDLPHVVAMVARLPIPPEGQTYHLWLTSDGRTFLAGVLPVNDQGFGLLTFDADRDGPIYEAAQLTLQVAGSEAPSGETVLAWSD